MSAGTGDFSKGDDSVAHSIGTRVNALNETGDSIATGASTSVMRTGGPPLGGAAEQSLEVVDALPQPKEVA